MSFIQRLRISGRNQGCLTLEGQELAGEEYKVADKAENVLIMLLARLDEHMY